MPPASELCRFRGGPLDGQRFPVRGVPRWVSVPMIAAAPEPVLPIDVPISEIGPRIVTHRYRRELWDDGRGSPSYVYVYRPPAP